MCFSKVVIYTISVILVDDIEHISLKKKHDQPYEVLKSNKILGFHTNIQLVWKQWWKCVLFSNMRIYIANWQGSWPVSMISSGC